MFKKALGTSGSFGKTSNAAAPSDPSCRHLARASLSTTVPLATFTKRPSGPRSFIIFSFIKPFVFSPPAILRLEYRRLRPFPLNSDKT